AGTLIAIILEVIGVLRLGLDVASGKTVALSSYLALDALGTLFAGVVALVGCVAAVYAIGYLREETKQGNIGMSRVRQFYLLFNLFLFSMFAAVMTTNLVLMWIAIEATTLSTVFLISFYGRPNTIEAAWKFLIINSVALLLGFLGTLLFVSTAGNAAIDPQILKIAFVLVIIGFGTKTGFVPLHTWLPDAHGMAPAPISSLLSGALLNVSLYALLRFKMLIDPVVGEYFSRSLFLTFGILSVVVAAFLIFNQRNYKRLLAYSSIEHMGIMALGFATGGAAIGVALLHMIYHAITKSLLFLASGTIVLKYKTSKIAGVHALSRVLPLTFPLFFFGLLSITGVPPFGIFYTEFSILAFLMADNP
ncbi:MAG: proton-conducting transporter membrane subunit, partial [Patescibacteria group bacterium]